MCCSKKWVGGLAALVLLVVGTGVAAPWVFPWIGLKWDEFNAHLQNQIPPEEKIELLAKDVKTLDTEIDKQYDKILTHKRAVDKTAKSIETSEESLATRWRAIKELDVAIKQAETDNRSVVTFEAKDSDVAKARKERTERWEAFKKEKAALDGKKALLAEQQATLESLNATYNDMKVAKQDLERQLAELKTKLEGIRAAQARNEAGQANDGWKTRWTSIHESMDKLNDQFDSMNHKVQEQGQNLKTANDTGVGQKVKNDLAAEEIDKFAAEQDASARNK